MKTTKQSRDSLSLSRLDQVKVLSDSRRYKIFEALARTPMSAKALATQWGLEPASLHYHFGVLAKAGLIRKVSERKVRGTVEKVFEAVAKRVHFTPGASSGKASSAAIASRAMEAGLDDVLSAEARRANGETALLEVRRYLLRITEQRAESFRIRLTLLLEEFESANEAAGDEYSVTLAVCQRALTEVDKC